MELEIAKKVIQKYAAGHAGFMREVETARRYYENEPDILREPPKNKRGEGEAETPMRNADNRVPFNFYGLLVNQKAAYMFTAPPLFDLGSKAANRKLTAFLGDKYAKVCKDLCINASNSSVGWLHFWKDDEGVFQYAVVPSEQIIPVWSKDLQEKLLAVLRTYTDIDDETGDSYIIYEYWTDTECSVYRIKTGEEIDALKAYSIFLMNSVTGESANEYRHGTGEVPFFPFLNNNIHVNDLRNIKALIDTYCKVFSGFVNDLEDIQEVIFILTNYGGQDLNEFLSDLKYYKTIKIDNYGPDDRSGVSTLTIDLPVEARDKLLTITRKCIFEQGQGIDPDPENFGNSSGVALNFLYALLELKAGLQETEFRQGFGRFIRCVCRNLGIPIKDDIIVQTWTRTSVKNDLEMSQIAQQSKGVISDETIISNHPWVENPEKEMETLKAEEEEKLDTYGFPAANTNGNEQEQVNPVNNDEQQ